jgi:iron complex outermembrane receptor protein
VKGTAVHHSVTRSSNLVSLATAVALALAFPLAAGADEAKDTPSAAAQREADEKKSQDSVDELPEKDEAEKKEKTKVDDEIVVTGSRVKTNYNGLGPVTTLSQEDLDLSGELNVSDLLKERPSIDFTGTNRFDTNGGRGRNTIGLRGLGPGRTLVLVNGRRFVQSSNGASDAVDLSVLSAGLFQEVEVLRDGVSTIYGADAVAGVINIRTRTNFEGFRMRLTGGATEEQDFENGEATLLWGKNFDRGNFAIGASLVGFPELSITDRSSTRSPIFGAFRDPTVPGGVRFDRDLFSFPQGISINPSIDPRNPNAITSFNPGPGGTGFKPLARDARGALDLSQDQTNINGTFPLTSQGDRASVGSQFNFEVTDNIEFFSEVSYSRLNTKTSFSPSFLDSSPTFKNPGGFQFLIANPELFGPGAQGFNNPFLPDGFAEAQFAAAGPLRDADGNIVLDENGQPVPQEVLGLTLFKSLDEFGPRKFESNSDTWRAIAGLRGTLPGPIDDINWEGYYNYGRSDDTFITKNDVNLTNALASIRPDLCDRTPGCVVGDFFGERGLVTNTPGALDFIRFNGRDHLIFHLKEVGVSATTTVAKLPAGDMRMSIGAQFREEDGSVSVDAVTLSGDSGGLSRSGTRGRQLVREGFYEAEIPLVEGIPLVNEFSVNISGRYTDYSTFGGRYLSRYALSYAPIKDLRFRGVYATSFRSPSISDLFLGPADSFVSVSDPCDGFPNVEPALFEGCQRELEAAAGEGAFTDDNPFGGFGNQSNQVRSNIGGSSQLSEETADSINVGFVYTPNWMPGMSLALDYFNIEVDNPVVFQSPNFRVNNCVLRNQLSECSAQQRDENGFLVFVDVPRTNFGEIQTHGLDFAVEYTKDIPKVGPARFAVEGVYTYDFEFTTFNGKSKTNGIIGGAGGAIPNMRMFFDMDFQPTEEVTISTSVEYIGRSKIIDRRIQNLPFANAPAAMYLDAAIRYQVTDRIALTLSGQNLTDKQPPLIIGDGTFTNTNTALYDVLGRRYFAVLTVDF